MSTALTVINKFEQSLQAGKEKIASLLGNNINPEKFIASVLLAVSKDKKLQNCTSESILEACYDAATLGLAIDARQLAYIVSYGTTAKLMPSYKGMVEMALKSGVVTRIFAEAVYENDHFKYMAGTMQVVEHEPLIKGNRGAFIAAYAIATFSDGTTQPCVMRLDEITKVRNKSRSSNSGPWVSDFEEMAKKTCVRRLFKLLPSNVIPTEAYEIDNAHFDVDKPSNTGEHAKVTPIDVVSEQPESKAEPKQASKASKTSTPPSEQDYRKSVLIEIHNLLYYHSAVTKVEALSFEQVAEKYSKKALQALFDILGQLTEKIKPILIDAVVLNQGEETRLHLSVPTNEFIKDKTESLLLEPSTLWVLYLNSCQRLEDELCNDGGTSIIKSGVMLETA